MTGTGRENEKVTAGLVNDIHKLMRCAFNQAKKWQYIVANPFLDATLPERKAKERPALTPAQLEEVFAYTDNMDRYDLYLIHVAMNLAFAGSMRGGEIGALQWKDIIDNDNRVLHISKAIDRVDKKALEKVSKTEIYFKFPNLFPQCKSVIVLKNTKEYGGSDRKCYLPEAVYEKLMNLKSLQAKMNEEFGDDGYIDYDLIICQANGRPIMTEHLNKRFQSVLNELSIKPHGAKDGESFVFHSIRSTATTYKLRISNGDIKAVQGENGQKDPKMVTHQYSRILDEDRRRISQKLDDEFYGKKTQDDITSNNVIEILTVLQSSPDLLGELMKRVSAG
jgi:integrase